MLWQLVVGAALLAQAVAQNPNPAANGVADKPPMGEPMITPFFGVETAAARLTPLAAPC